MFIFNTITKTIFPMPGYLIKPKNKDEVYTQVKLDKFQSESDKYVSIKLEETGEILSKQAKKLKKDNKKLPEFSNNKEKEKNNGK